MFDLDKSIAAWLGRFEHERAMLPEDVREVEQHVRDHVDDLIAEGISPEAAFIAATREFGEEDEVRTAYRDVLWGKLKRHHTVSDHLSSEIDMLKNYLKITVRNLLRQKGYSFINVAGLTLGLTCCLLIFQYVAFEYSFDDFNENAADLYRVLSTQMQNERDPFTQALTGWAVGPALAEETPEVVRYTRLHPEYNNAVISNPAKPARAFEEEHVYYADPSFFEMFSYPLIKGRPGQALSEPGTVLLSESAARRYFGSDEPIGQMLDVRGWISGDFRVAGVFEDVPANSHLRFNILLPMVDLLQRSSFSDVTTGWDWNNFITYVQLRDNADVPHVERTFTDVYMRHRAEDLQQRNASARIDVQPLHDIHLNQEIAAPKAVMGSYRTVYFFTLIGLVTLLIALINYVNLATARAIRRAREVGVRKVVGAQQRQLVTQFLTESALTNGMAVLLAVALAVLLRPLVNNVAGTTLTGAIWASPVFWMAFFTTFCAATLLAGLYPALVLSSFRPVAVLKGTVGTSAAGAWLRRGLVVVQFAASIVLLIGTAVVYSQLNYMRNMDLGLDLEQILSVPSPRVLPEGADRAQAVETFTQQLRQAPAVRHIATSFTVPGRGFMYWTNNLRRATEDASTGIDAAGTVIDTSFASLYGLELLAGEGFKHTSYSTPEGEPDPIIVNEMAVQALGFGTPEEAVDQELSHGRVVGVFKNFSWSSAHEAPVNAIFHLDRGNPQISIKVSTQDLPKTITAIAQAYERHFPGDPFRYAFVDEQFDAQYRNEERFATLFGLFAGLAIAIACLGLFGLASFTTQQRTKEIGVRKVLGASVPGVVALLSRDFLKLVGAAFVLAAPLAYFVMSRWLEGFAYRTNIGVSVFLMTGGIALFVAVLTVSYQSIKAALANPVKSLRYV